MKRFVIVTSLFCLISLSLFVLILCQADGYTDAFYLRFTTPKQDNLILGTSRAAQGLQPSVILKTSGISFYNYSFTVRQSPYGPTYLRSIQNKLNQISGSHKFIITIDPWSISSQTKNPNDSASFRELNMALENTKNVNINPNLEYIFKNLKGEFYNVLKPRSKLFLHNDGWLEVSVNMDSATNSKNITKKMNFYKQEMLPMYKFSSLRLKYLIKTINYLNTFGEVYLVRLPIHPELMTIEELLMPNFDNIISSITPLTNGYLDLTDQNHEFSYTDGNHLHKSSGKDVSEQIAIWIRDN